MARLSPERREAIIQAVKAGRTVPEIHAATGESKETIRYVAASAGMTIVSRYCRVIRGSYWHSLRGRYWRAKSIC